MKEHALNTIADFEVIRAEFKHTFLRLKLAENNFFGELPNQIDKVIIYLNLNLQNFHDNLCNKDKFDKILPTESWYDYNEVLQTYFNQNKAAFIYNLSSVIETFFRKLHEEIFPGVKVERKDFYFIAKKIFSRYSFEYGDEWKCLMILSNLRNTIHYNGVHTSENRVFEYHGYNLNFINGYPQNVAHYKILESILYDFKILFEKIVDKKNYG